ncbi:MAG: NAD(P)/FAD-dependent oxidoreductase [Deltaproteobacteria bacterium]|nr:NAD(P)/FAD-dependent oxidoreductase [Deltaproteobacteria bacterium]
MYDVIIVGAGPAGSAVAKKCAEYDLNTLLLEKKMLPRNKVCSGMVLGSVANGLIKEEFGDIPEYILCRPGHLSGAMFHVPGVGSKKADESSLLTWRKDLDCWMNQGAKAMGAEIWQGSRFTRVREEGNILLLEVEKDGQNLELRTRFVVGADGARSIVRKCLFPNFKINYLEAYQEHFSGQLDLDKNYFHSFRTTGSASYRFGIVHKDDFFILSFGSGFGQMKMLVKWTKDFLSKHYNFSINQKPVHREACLAPMIHKELMSGMLSPVKGNILLVGEAGGFIMPVIMEGIGIGIKSGIMAANSIKKSLESGRQAGVVYIEHVQNIISIFRKVQPFVGRIGKEIEQRKHSVLELLSKANSFISDTYN